MYEKASGTVPCIDCKNQVFDNSFRKRILTVFLVGAFPLREKCPTIAMTVFSRRFSREKCPTYSGKFFFVRLQSHSDWATFLTIETTKTTSIRGQVRSAEISAKGSPFHFLLFYRNLQNRTRLKGSIFFRHCATFFENFLMSQKSHPFEFFDILQQNMLIEPKGSPFYIFRHYATFSERKKIKFQVFFQKKICAF